MDARKPPGALEAMREGNRTRLVDALRRAGTASRADLARATGLSRSTVSSLVADLQERGVVAERGDDRSRAGRPGVLLALDPSAGAAVGVDFGHSHLRVAVSDLSSPFLAERLEALDVDHRADEALDRAAGLVDEVLADAGIERARVLGAGMGLPGPIDRRTGTVGSSVILPGWAGVRAAEAMSARLDLPVIVDNDANLGALAEVAVGAGRGLTDVVYVKIASGIGAGLVLGGRLHHGATGVAGELGHVQVRADGAVCRCGNRGCLETVAASGALMESMRGAHGPLTVPALLGLAAAGDLGAGRILEDAGRAVGSVLADLCNHLNPEAIVVGGELAAAGEPLLAGMREAIGRRAQPAAAAAVRVMAGVLGERAELLGALALVVGDTERLRSAGLPSLALAR